MVSKKVLVKKATQQQSSQAGDVPAREELGSDVPAEEVPGDDEDPTWEEIDREVEEDLPLEKALQEATISDNQGQQGQQGTASPPSSPDEMGKYKRNSGAEKAKPKTWAQVASVPGGEEPEGKKRKGKGKGKEKAVDEAKPARKGAAWSEASTDGSTAAEASSAAALMELKNDGPIRAAIDPELDEKIERTIAEATAAQERKRQQQKDAMMRVLARGNAVLWEQAFGWDVLVVCDGMTWRVHRKILVAESSYFAEKLPPARPDGAHVTFDCGGHQRESLGAVLHFMYFKHYEGAYTDYDDPLNGECIRLNAAMFIAGASVDCRAMMDFATDAIDDTTETMEALMPTFYRHDDLARFHAPLREALAIAFDQGDRQIVVSLRLALACLVDVTMGHLILNPTFKAAFERDWCPWVILNCLRDNDHFVKAGWLEPVPEGQMPPLRAALAMVAGSAFAAAATAAAIAGPAGSIGPAVAPVGFPVAGSLPDAAVASVAQPLDSANGDTTEGDKAG